MGLQDRNNQSRLGKGSKRKPGAERAELSSTELRVSIKRSYRTEVGDEKKVKEGS